MQRIAHKASFKAADGNFTLQLSVQHVLHFPALQYDENPRHSSLETLAQNPLLFTLSGSKDGILATHDELLTSKTTNHLPYYLRKNAFQLGLDTISRIALSQASIPPAFSVSFANVEPMDELSLRQPMLSSIHLNYRWKTCPISCCDGETSLSDLYDDPFAKDLTLPLQTLLDDVIARFVKNSLVRRYPFVFGNLACQFNNEATYFRPMAMSIKRIINRSLDPTFRSQCGRLLKLLRHRFSPLSDLDHTAENHDRYTSRYRLSTEAVFHLAMQHVFKAGMKCTAFKGAHGFVLDIEEHELLETEPQETGLLPDRVSSPTAESLILDQDEDVSVSNNQPWGVPFFEILNSPLFFVNLAPPIADDIILHGDSEDDDGLCDLDDLILAQETAAGNITIDLDDSDEGELPSTVLSRSAESPAASYGVNVPALPVSERFRKSPEGIIGSSSARTCTECYVENVDRFRLPQANCTQRSEPLYKASSNDVPSGHDARQAQSGDTRTSQAKGSTNHMVRPVHWWTQVALSTDLCATRSRASRASISLDLEHPIKSLIVSHEFPLDMDLDEDLESDDSLDLLIETETGIQELRNICTGYNLDEATVCLPSHHDFLDVLSEEIYSEEEFNTAGQGADAMASVLHPDLDCIIDEDMMTASPNSQFPERSEERVLGDCFLYEDSYSGAGAEFD